MVNLLNVSSTWLFFLLSLWNVRVFNLLVKGSNNLPDTRNNSTNEICKANTYTYKKPSFL